MIKEEYSSFMKKSISGSNIQDLKATFRSATASLPEPREYTRRRMFLCTPYLPKLVFLSTNSASLPEIRY